MTVEVLEIFKETLEALKNSYSLVVVTDKFLADLCSVKNGKRECISFGEAVPELNNFMVLTNQEHALLLGSSQREMPDVGKEILQEIYGGKRWFPALKTAEEYRWDVYQAYLPYAMLEPIFAQIPLGLLDGIVLNKKEDSEEPSSIVWAYTLRPMSTTITAPADMQSPTQETTDPAEIEVPYGSEVWAAAKRNKEKKEAEDNAAVNRGEGKALVCPVCGTKLIFKTETTYAETRDIFISPAGKVYTTLQTQHLQYMDDVEAEIVCPSCGWQEDSMPELFVKDHPDLVREV